MSLPPIVVVPLGILGFVGFWCLVCWVIARIGGWHGLVARFPAGPHKPPGVRMFYLQSMELGAAQYKGGVSIGVAPAGLYLSVLPLFAIGHAPILVPWNAVTGLKTEKQWWLTRYELSVPLQRFDTATITLFDAALVAALSPHLALPIA